MKFLFVEGISAAKNLSLYVGWQIKLIMSVMKMTRNTYPVFFPIRLTRENVVGPSSTRTGYNSCPNTSNINSALVANSENLTGCFLGMKRKEQMVSDWLFVYMQENSNYGLNDSQNVSIVGEILTSGWNGSIVGKISTSGWERMNLPVLVQKPCAK